MEYTLITGASSGIGLEMARRLAEQRHNLILVARRGAQLQALQFELGSAFGIDVQCIPCDLSKPLAAQEVHQAVTERGLVVSGLINNAGFGAYGNFVDMPLDRDEDMVAVNITALMGLTKLFGAEMASRGTGRIMNVASILSFVPFPYYSVYSATKSFVLVFTETVAAELRNSGVVLTALCPGTVETDFHTDSMRRTRAMKANKPATVQEVAQVGVELFLNGHGKNVVGFTNWLLSNLPRVVPDAVMMRIKLRLASLRPSA